MNKNRSYLILCPVLILFWLFPLLYGSIWTDPYTVRVLSAYLVFLVAVCLCRLLPNLHAALISAALLGGGLCVLWQNAVFDILPALLMCCWLRCMSEQEKGNPVAVYFELFTDLIYVYLIAAVIRLIRTGYSFLTIEKADTLTIPDLCLMVVLFVASAAMFFREKKGGTNTTRPGSKKRQKGSRRRTGNMAGLIPVYISRRTFFCFFAILLAVALLQYTNGNCEQEALLFFRTGMRLLCLPWMTILFLGADAFSVNSRDVDHSKGRIRSGSPE